MPVRPFDLGQLQRRSALKAKLPQDKVARHTPLPHTAGPVVHGPCTARQDHIKIAAHLCFAGGLHWKVPVCPPDLCSGRRPGTRASPPERSLPDAAYSRAAVPRSLTDSLSHHADANAHSHTATLPTQNIDRPTIRSSTGALAVAVRLMRLLHDCWEATCLAGTL